MERIEDSSVVEVNVELAADQHFPISSSLPMSKSCTSQRQSEYTNYTVEDVKDTKVDRMEMHRDMSSPLQRSRSQTGHRKLEPAYNMVEYMKSTSVDRVEMPENSRECDQVTGRGTGHSCISSCKRTMDKGNRLVSAVDITLKKVSTSGDSFAKTNT